MNKMLELYQNRYGSAVRRQGDGYNGPCPLCGGEPGKSDRFMVWDYKTENLSKVCTDNGIAGIYNCRQCGATGDTVSYLINIEGMTFKGALDELGIKPHITKYRKARKAPKFQDKAQFAPKERTMPISSWQDFTAKLQEKAMQNIQEAKEAKKYLHARGICDDAILEYRLGYLQGENRKQGIFRMRSALGLEPKEKNGSTKNRIFIPRGITIPTYVENELVSLRIRRPKADIAPTPNGYTPPKYMELEGSAKMPFILLPVPHTEMSCFVVVEAELDAILIHHATGKQVGVVAVRSNQNKPCPVSHELLQNCPRILFAMDYEESNAGIAAMDFWEENYPQLRRWMTPEGKDPGEAYQLGVDIALWITAGLPQFYQNTPMQDKKAVLTAKSPDLPQTTISQKNEHIKQVSETGQLDTLQTGTNNLGGKGNVFLYLYKFWGLDCLKYKHDGTTIVGKNKAFVVDKENDSTEAIQAYSIGKFIENPEVLAWFAKHKHKWINFEDIERELKKEGLL